MKIQSGVRDAILSIAAVALAACAGTALAQKKYDTGASDKEIKIGNTMAYSGPASVYSVFGKNEPRVIGVLDWELSTLGHPVADISAQCMSWHIPPQLWRGIAGLDLNALGIPSEAEYLRMHVDATGRDPSRHWDFYMAYNLFRISAILLGIAQRAADGTAAADDAMETGQKAGPLAELG